ncbi:unnamed protein product [Rhodiola kirilowii]
MAESESKNLKPRPIVRLGIYLISHSFLFSVICCASGVIALLLLPILAKNTYISENALIPGSATSMLTSQDVTEANRLVKDITDLSWKGTKDGLESQRLIAQYMSDLGAEVNHHSFQVSSNSFHPLQFFSSPDPGMIQDKCNCSRYGISTIGVIRAPRGDGKESIVLVTPYNSAKIDGAEAMSVGVAYSVFSLLSRVTWLAKDIIWLVADSQHGEYTAVYEWLREYHAPIFNGFRNMKDEENLDAERGFSDDFRRAGTMAAALVIKIADRPHSFQDTLTIYAEASNGQMPNLDLINVVNYLAVHKQGFHVKVDKLMSLLDSKWLKLVGDVFEFVGNFARRVNPQWGFGIPASDYLEGTATLASSLYTQALGIPTGPHGAFRDYQVDAITLEISPRILKNKARRIEFLTRTGRLIEGVVRSVNNLLEKFHQSFFLYLLTSSGKFVSVGVYMIAFGLIVAPLPVAAASLHAGSGRRGSYPERTHNTPDISSTGNENDHAQRSWHWLYAANLVCVMHMWGVAVSLLPYFIAQIPNSTPLSSVIIWVLLSGVCLLVLYLVSPSPVTYGATSQISDQEWATLKATTLSATFIGLSIMSVINFATAEFGALLLVPICLLAHPLKLDITAKSYTSLARAVCNVLFGFIGCPLVTFLLLKGASEGFKEVNVGHFWTWFESLWAWNSATYLYIGMVHVPSWVLCLHILFHPCH